MEHAETASGIGGQIIKAGSLKLTMSCELSLCDSNDDVSMLICVSYFGGMSIYIP